MKKVILICGKICSGKSYYAAQLKEKYNAVILSTDEATFDLIENEQGEFYNIFAAKVNLYLRKKAAEIVKSGANVILDWGFWTKQNRQDISDYFTSLGVDFEWHYIDVDDETCFMALTMIRIMQHKIKKCLPQPDDSELNWSYGITGEKLVQILSDWKVDALPYDYYRMTHSNIDDLKLLFDAFEMPFEMKLFSSGDLRKLKSSVEVL